MPADFPLANLLVALGIGLLVGGERERHKGSARRQGATHGIAGVRTFAITALLGAVCLRAGGELLLAVALAAVTWLCAIGLHGRAEGNEGNGEAGLTTEVALILTLLLGALAASEPALASALGVTLAVLLAARDWLHHFIRAVVTEQEMWDALIIAAATLVVLPLVPDRYLGPFDAINPRTTWLLVVLIMAVSAAGHVASRALGARLGLPAAGFAAGFVSSTATVAAMGGRARAHPDLLAPAALAALLSNLATIVQLVMVLSATHAAVLQALWLPLALSGLATLAYAGLYALRRAARSPAPEELPGAAFSIRTALLLALTISAILLLSSALEQWLGRAGVMAAALIGGLGDVHSTAASMASMAAAGRFPASAALIPIMLALTANTVSKVVVAAVTGGRPYLRAVLPGLLLMLAAAWLGVWLHLAMPAP